MSGGRTVTTEVQILHKPLSQQSLSKRFIEMNIEHGTFEVHWSLKLKRFRFFQAAPISSFSAVCVIRGTRRMKQFDATRISKHFCCSDAIICFGSTAIVEKGSF